MRRVDIVSDIETLSAIGTGRRALLNRAVEHALYLFAAAYDWPVYRDVGVIQTVDDVTVNDVTVTNNSRTVTKSAGTDWSGNFAQRKFRVGSSNQFYRIRSRDSATTLTLEDLYLGSTASAQSYTIFQDEYRLDGNVHKLLDIRQLEDSLMMLGLSYVDIDRWFPDPDVLDDPTYFALVGRRDARYTTGTVAVTAASRTITGSSTLWTQVQGLSRGNRISIDDTGEVYTIDTVDSDTSLTVYESPATGDSSSAYRIYLNNLIVVARDVPDAARNLYYRFQRLPYPLARDGDEPDMPREYHYGLVWGGIWIAYTLLGNHGAAQEAKKTWSEWLQLAISQIGHDVPTTSVPRQSLDVFTLRTLEPRLPSQYGYPLSIPL